MKLASDHYYTLVNNASGSPQLIEEPPFKNKQKSLVRVQNLSDKALTLKTADGKTDVVKASSAKGRGEREINPVKVSLALFDGDKKVSDLKPVALERGEAAVLYVTGNGSSLSPVWVKRPYRHAANRFESGREATGSARDHPRAARIYGIKRSASGTAEQADSQEGAERCKTKTERVKRPTAHSNDRFLTE